jgi:hypothetical protein
VVKGTVFDAHAGFGFYLWRKRNNKTIIAASPFDNLTE